MKSIHLRFLDDKLYETIKKRAKKNRRSLNNEIINAIQFYLEMPSIIKALKEEKEEWREIFFKGAK